MKVISTLLTLIVVLVAAVILIPVLGIMFALVPVIAIFIIWLLPVIIIATSDKTTGFEKIAWLLAMFCLSWFAWVFYFFLAPLKPRRDYHYY